MYGPSIFNCFVKNVFSNFSNSNFVWSNSVCICRSCMDSLTSNKSVFNDFNYSLNNCINFCHWRWCFSSFNISIWFRYISLIVFFTWLLINGNFSCNSVRISIWFWVTFCQNKCWWWCEVKWSEVVNESQSGVYWSILYVVIYPVNSPWVHIWYTYPPLMRGERITMIQIIIFLTVRYLL